MRIEPTPPDAIADSDESLLEAGRHGDARALSRLIDRHGEGLAAFVNRKLGVRRDWAEDVLQDLYVTIAATAHRYEGRSAIRTWLFGIARNLCRERVRRERPVVQDDRSFAALPDAALDPLQRLVRSERAALVRAALAQLSAEHRRILRLRDREDLSYEQIARLLGIPVGTVRSRVHNARAALARALGAGLRTRGR